MSKTRIIIIIVVVLVIIRFVFGKKINRFLAGIFTSKEKKEDYIKQLMNGIPYSKDNDEVYIKMCNALTKKDLADKKLNKKLIYTLEKYRDASFAADAVMQASNSDSLMKTILDDVTTESYKNSMYDCYCAEDVLKAAYRKGYYKKDIQAKDGTMVKPSFNFDSCIHEDTPAEYFRL